MHSPRKQLIIGILLIRLWMLILLSGMMIERAMMRSYSLCRWLLQI